MGGKGQRRREKNYKAAHGGNSRLPPPPVASSLDAVPSKLRKLMAFTNSSQSGSANESVSNGQRDRGGRSGSNKDKLDSGPSGMRGKSNDVHSLTAKQMNSDDEMLQNSAQEKRKKKKKRKRVTDLRFETLEDAGVGLKRREHKKKRLEAKKKKQKKGNEENEDFPGHEKIKFGDVVQAPPKLVAVPKGLKTHQDASQERLRLMAVEAYRNRRGWTSRPGVDLPPPVTTSPSSN